MASMIQFVWDLFGKPAMLAGALVWAIFGTRKGTAVENDYTWMIGGIILLAGIVLQSSIMKLKDRLEALETELDKLKSGNIGNIGTEDQ